MNILDIKNNIISEMKDGLYAYKSDNAILFTVEFYILCKNLGIFDDDDKKRLHHALSKIARYVNEDRVKGLYNRRPEANTRKEQHDNYMAICATTIFGDEFKKYSNEILDYGKQFWWYSYDNRSPNQFSINPFWKPLFRLKFLEALKYFECCKQGYHVFFYQVTAKRFINPLYYLWFVGKCLVERNDRQTSGKLLNWVRFSTIGNKWYMRWLVRRWERRMAKIFGDDYLSKIFEIYFGKDSDLHKLCVEYQRRTGKRS